jgi:hypothetical protein
VLLAAAPGAATAGEIPIGEPATPRQDCPASSAICHASNYAVATPEGGSVTNSVRYTARAGTYRGGSTERMFSSFGVGAHPAWTGIDGYRAYIDVSGTYAPLFTPFACIMPPGARADSDLCDGGFSSSQDSPRQFIVTVRDDARRIRVGWNFAPTRQQTINGGQAMTAFVRWFALDLQPPSFAFDPVAGDGGAEPTISGQARDNVSLGAVTLTIDDVEVATAGPDGRVRHTASGLDPGPHTATVRATDGAGNSSLSSQTFYVYRASTSVASTLPAVRCRHFMIVVQSMTWFTRRLRDRPCWRVWFPRKRGSRIRECEFDRARDARVWAWNDVTAHRVAAGPTRAAILKCQKSHRNRFPGVLYFAYGGGSNGKVAFWNLGHAPAGSLAKHRLVELYPSRSPRSLVQPAYAPPAYARWLNRKLGMRATYGAMVNVGSTQSDRTVLDAVRRVCRATTVGVMGIYAGHNFKAQWEPRRRRVAAVLDRCTR